MKRLFYFVAVLFAVSVVTSSCATAKRATAPTIGLVEQTLPLSEARHRTDAEYYRAVQSGKSTDMSMAKKVAIQNARQELAASIKADLEGVVENYAPNRQLPSDEKSTFETRMTELSYTVVQQTLAGSTLSDEKLFTTPTGEYQYFVCMQINKADMKEALLNELQKNEKLISDFEISEFRKLYEKKLSEYQQK